MTTQVTAGRRRTGRWIDDWQPEDEQFWETTGKRVARRNLGWSIFAENLGFSVWLLWSVVVVNLGKVGFTFSVDQLFWLIALPNLVGSTLRLPYTFAVPKFGGRNWTVVSAVLLLVPTGLLAVAVSNPSTPYWFFLLAAATAGVGGGNFASSMANISFFYPERKKGLALGLNAAGGNIGVAVVQLVVPIVITLGTGIQLVYAALMWMPFIIVAAAGAWLRMDNLSEARSDFRGQAMAVKRGQTWVMSFLYIGTFGSFIGYSAAFPLLISREFPDVTVAHFAFLGALVGSVSRPFGGWLADRIGGSVVTLWTFGAMGMGVLGVLWALSIGSFGAFLAMFMLLFATSGIGNGSTYRMIPAIFRAKAIADANDPAGPDRDTALARGKREAAACIGIASAVGAFGGFLIPRSFGVSINASGGLTPAFVAFLGMYVVCMGVTWFVYLRRRVLVARVPSLAHAAV